MLLRKTGNQNAKVGCSAHVALIIWLCTQELLYVLYTVTDNYISDFLFLLYNIDFHVLAWMKSTREKQWKLETMLFSKRTFNSYLFTTLKILLTHATHNAFQTFNTEPVLNQSSYIIYFCNELESIWTNAVNSCKTSAKLLQLQRILLTLWNLCSIIRTN